MKILTKFQSSFLYWLITIACVFTLDFVLASLKAVSVTVKVPALLYACVTVVPVVVAASPKSHSSWWASVEQLVNVKEAPTLPVVGVLLRHAMGSALWQLRKEIVATKANKKTTCFIVKNDFKINKLFYFKVEHHTVVFMFEIVTMQ